MQNARVFENYTGDHYVGLYSSVPGDTLNSPGGRSYERDTRIQQQGATGSNSSYLPGSNCFFYERPGLRSNLGLAGCRASEQGRWSELHSELTHFVAFRGNDAICGAYTSGSGL